MGRRTGPVRSKRGGRRCAARTHRYTDPLESMVKPPREGRAPTLLRGHCLWVEARSATHPAAGGVAGAGPEARGGEAGRSPGSSCRGARFPSLRSCQLRANFPPLFPRSPAPFWRRDGSPGLAQAGSDGLKALIDGCNYKSGRLGEAPAALMSAGSQSWHI